MAAGHAEIDTANLDVSHLLGLHNRVANVFFRGGGVGNLTLAHAARARLTETHNIQRAVRAEFTDNGAYLGRADFQSDDDGGGIKHVSSSCEVLWAAGALWAPPRWLQ